MGNEQSRGSASSSSTGGGVSSSLSFLSRNRPSLYKASPIVVVNSRGNTFGDPDEDENLKKLREIPRFTPLLKGVLPGQRDSPSVYSKVDPRHISRFVHRLQEHFTICNQTVTNEQTALFARISEIDNTTSALFRRISVATKKYDSMSGELKRAQNLNAHLESIQLNMDGIIRDLEMLNELLPDERRLPKLPNLKLGVAAEVATDALESV